MLIAATTAIRKAMYCNDSVPLDNMEYNRLSSIAGDAAMSPVLTLILRRKLSDCMLVLLRNWINKLVISMEGLERNDAITESDSVLTSDVSMATIDFE